MPEFLLLLTSLIAPGAPVPEGPKAPAGGTVDRYAAEYFARMVDQLALQVKEKTVREGVTENELIAGAIQGLYDEVGLPVPDKLKTAVQEAKTSVALVELLAATRIQLGNHPALAGTRSLFAAMNGFKHATDPLSMLVSPRMNAYASVDQDFGIGIEIEGVTGLRWTIYQAENGIASGRYASVGYFGPIPRVDAIPSPAHFPWQVKRVVPGSPAQKGGVKPGDRITHIDRVEVNADNANRVFASFAMPSFVFDPMTGMAMNPDRVIAFQRDNNKPFDVSLKGGGYSPESAFGVIRLNEDKWDCMLDRDEKIGYIRISAIEMDPNGTDSKVADMMEDLMKQGCRGLILDLRWCPGGYVTPGSHIAGMFLKDGAVIAKMQYRTFQNGSNGDLIAHSGSGKYVDLPLALLVGQETTGGGELIASALRDNNRCVVIGQRSVGRASIQNIVDAGFAGVQFKLTTGTSLRPNGKSRQRKPESQPNDDWGIRPDEGLEVPITTDKSLELRREAELQALRPADSRQAMSFDDPEQDPYRHAALVYLRKKLGPAK